MSIPAQEIIYLLDNFHEPEFPSGALRLTDASLLSLLQSLRTQWDQSIHPSRHPDGWARMAGRPSSRHYAVGRLSDAGDIFPTGNVINFWQMCVADQSVGGLGIYFDTRRGPLQPGPMIHIDLRPRRLLWSRIAGVYYYFSDPKEVEAHRITYKAMTDYLEQL